MNFHAAAADEVGDDVVNGDCQRISEGSEHAEVGDAVVEGGCQRISEGREFAEAEPPTLQANHSAPAPYPEAVNNSAPAPASLSFFQPALPTGHHTQQAQRGTVELIDTKCAMFADDDDCGWLNDSLNSFELSEHQEPLYRGIEFGDSDCGMFTGPAEMLDEMELESPKYRCMELESNIEFPEAEHLGWSPPANDFQLANEDHQDTLQEMRTLDLSVTDIADAGLTFLSAFSKITSLNLFSTKVTDDGLEHVAKLDCLIELDLCGTEVSDAGLSRLEPLKSLEILKLCGNQRVTDDGAFQVLKALAALHCLELRSTSVSEEGLQQVAEILGLRTKVLMA